MLGGISDRLIIGFDMSGDDKACLTVGRENRGSLQVIKQFMDRDAEILYEELSGICASRQTNNITDFIDHLIEDMEDSIDDYKDSRSTTYNRIESAKYTGRILELSHWITSLKDLRKEYE